MGDDLLAWKTITQDKTFWEAVFLDTSANKYRPLLNLVQYILYNLFNLDHRMFTGVNLLFNFIVISVLFKLILKMTSNNIIALLVSVIFLTSRFGYYNIVQVFGIMELMCLFLLLMTIYHGFFFYKYNKIKYMYFVLIYNLMILFIHERFIVLFPFILLVIYFKEDLNKKTKSLLYILAVMPVIINFSIKSFVFNIRFFEGTGYTGIDFNIWRIIKFFLSSLLNIFGINTGPEHIIGIPYKMSPSALQTTSIGILLVLIIIFIMYAMKLKYMSKYVRIKQLKVFIVFLILLCSLLLVSSVTIYVELRWLYAPFLVLLIYTTYIIAETDVKMKYKYLIVTMLFLLSITNNIQFKQYLPNVYYYFSQQISDDLYNQTIKEYGNSLKNYEIYIEKAYDIQWPLLDSLFFQAYLNDKSFKVNYVDNVNDIIMGDFNANKLIFKYKDKKMLNVTKEVIYSQEASNVDMKKRYDFAEHFDESKIISSEKIYDTPNSKGAFLNDWEISSYESKMITMLSGVDLIYNDININPNDKLVLSLYSPINAGDGYSFFVKIHVDNSEDTIIFTKEISPPFNESSDLFTLFYIPLDEYSGKKVDIVFEVTSPSGDQSADWLALPKLQITN